VIEVVVLLLASSSWCSQPLREEQVEAAYLFSFSKFVDWPPQAFESSAAPIRLCVLRDPSFESELNQIVRGKTVGGRSVAVLTVDTAEQSRACHILFIGSARDRESRQIVNALRHASVLTVGESPGFIDSGGMINFSLQNDRIQLQVNHRATTQAGIHVSSRLLGVAKLVVE
jgi:hypothetical protein